MASDPSRVTLTILGQVQGVFFRASTLEQAQRQALRGWVRNLPDGSVEIVAEGERYALEELVAWARRGPPAAQVQEVIVRWAPYAGEFSAFQVR